MSNLAKISRKPVTIQLDKERTLKYTLNSFAKMEETYGSVDKALAAMQEGSIRAIIFMLWAGLRHEDKDLTIDSVGDMVDILDMDLVSQKMNEVMGKDLPDKGQENPNA